MLKGIGTSIGLACALGLVGEAQGADLRYSDTAAGSIVATGNALGLAKQFDANGPGTSDSMGTFSSLDPAAQDLVPANPGNAWFAETTSDWTENGAEAELMFPPQADVLYAELVWGGSTFYGAEDVRDMLDTEVMLSFGADAIMVPPSPATALTLEETAFSGFLANNYMRSAEVTQFVVEHGSGIYAVSGVPGTQDAGINQLNAAGWTLVVAYRDSAERIRNLTIFVGGSFVDEDSTEDYDFAGFCTPPSGPFDGSLVISAMEGDAHRTGDSLGIAPTAADVPVLLSGPNNPVDNFFCSQINDSTGNLDTSGTHGDRNHNALGAVNVAGGRQSWDITQLPISSGEGHLVNGQTAAVVRTQTASDSYVPVLVAMAIGVNAPDFSGDGTGAGAAPGTIELDQTSTVTIDMENVGLVDAEDLLFSAPLPTGLELESFAIDGTLGNIDGDPVVGADLATGVAIGSVDVSVARQLTIVVRSTGAPDDPPGNYLLSPRWDYRYVSCVGDPPLTEPHSTLDVVIEFVPPAGTTTGADGSSGDGTTGDSASASASVSATAADATATDSDTNSETGESDSAGFGGDSGGCGCRSGPVGAGWLWALVLVVPTLRRRR